MDSEQSFVEQDPFSADFDGRYIYLNARHEELLATLIAAIAEGRTRLLVVGGEGSGKSSFLRKLAELLYTSGDIALLGHDLVFSCQHDTSLEAIEAAVLVTATVCEGESQRPETAVLLLDDADRLDPEVLASLWHRWPVLNETWPAISVVMSAQPEPKRLHGPGEHDAMAAELTFDLPPLALADVESLIKHRLQVAGYPDVDLFTPDAIARIAYFSKRVPARIVQLCQYILAQPGRDVSTPVTEDVVKDAAYELFLPDHLQKLARGLGCQSKPLWTNSRVGRPGDGTAASETRTGFTRTGRTPESNALTRHEASYEDSPRIAMPPPPAGVTGSGLLPMTGPPPRRRHRRFLRLGAKLLAVAGGILLLIGAAVVAVAVKQSYQLSKPPFEAAVEAPDSAITTDEEDDRARTSADSPAREQDAADRPAPPAAPEGSAGGPSDLAEALQTADPTGLFAGATGERDINAVSSPLPAEEPLAQVEPRRQPPLIERNDLAFVQSELNARGYRAGPVDGIMGPRTRSAIQRFQADTGLPVDGRMNDALIATLRRQAAKSDLQMQRRARPRRRILPALRGQLDSVAFPQEFQEYCRNNQDTWVFDRGTNKFVFCGTVLNQR